MKARELGKNSIVVGDLIRLDGDVSGDSGTLARAVEVMPRKNLLSEPSMMQGPLKSQWLQMLNS